MLIIGMALASVLLTSACGQAPASREQGAPAPAPAAAGQAAAPAGAARAEASTAPDKPVEQVKVTVPTKSLTFLPFYFGQDKGIFREEGVDLELIQMRPPIGITALEAGDVAYSAAPGVGMRAAIQGAPLRAVMFAQTKPSFSLIGQPDTAPDKIKTVAVSGLRSTAHYAALAVMKKLGRGGPDDATYFATGDTAQSYTALLSKVADAAILSPPYTSMATLAGYVDLGDAFDMHDVQGGLVTTVRRIQEQPAQVRAVLRGTLRSLDYIAGHEEELVGYLQREFNLDRGVAAGSYAIVKQVLNTNGDIDEPVLRSVVAQMKQDAEVAEEVPLERIVDLSLLREVHSELNIRK